MTPDLSGYPPTKKGAEALIQALLPHITGLWRTERQGANDDLVAVINAHNNTTYIKNRTSVYSQIKAKSPKVSILKKLKKPAPNRNGSITIWAIIGFSAGNVCLQPVVVARS